MKVFFQSDFEEHVFTDSDHDVLASVDCQEINMKSLYNVLPVIGDKINFSIIDFVDNEVNTIASKGLDGIRNLPFTVTERVFDINGIYLYCSFIE